MDALVQFVLIEIVKIVDSFVQVKTCIEAAIRESKA